MPGCLGCPTSNSTTISGVWTDFRYHYGPNPDNMGTEVNGGTYRDVLYVQDLTDYSEWALSNGVVDPLNDLNYAIFRNWFSWKLIYGSNSGGNFPVRIRDHVGLTCAKCPYSTDCDDIRATHMVGSVPAVQTDHGEYYMKIEGRGSAWGFGCTYSGCSYLLDTGNNYFYV